jgi:hypothetical protein
MAQVKNNVLLSGLSGKLGDSIVFRQLNGKTIVAKLPGPPQTSSEKQKKMRGHFQQAIIYAKNAVRAADTKERYAAEAKKRKGLTAYNVAIADFFHAPDIHTVDLSKYAGNTGDEIHVTASDDFAVQSVHVQIHNADGSLVEEGYASHTTDNVWVYVATCFNESLDGDRIVVTASDLPGNTTSEERNV